MLSYPKRSRNLSNPTGNSSSGRKVSQLSIFSKATNPNKVIRVVEFSSGGYKIKKIFAYESTYPKEIIAVLRIGVVARCQKLGIILVIKSFKN